VGTHTAYRLQHGGQQVESPAWELNTAAARHWRLRTESPHPPTEWVVHWRAPQLLFVASGKAPYRLEVGRHDAPAKQAMAPATLIPGYQPGAEHRLPQAQLAALQQRAAGSAWHEASAKDKQRWVLWAALGAAVAGLGALAWRLMRDMGKGSQ
jgi:hypothetical protein